MSPSLSVVIPTRNSARYLPELFASLGALSQQPTEYVIVDGHSTDATLAIISEFSPGVPVRLVSAAPLGVYDAWNRGVAISRGEWIWVVCSDDKVRTNSISEALKAAAGAGIDVGFISWFIDIIDAEGRTLSRQEDGSVLKKIDLSSAQVPHIRSAELEAALIYLFRAYFVSFMSQMFRKCVWEGHAFRNDIGPSGDVEWMFKAHLRGWRKMHIPTTLAAWREHRASITGRFGPLERINSHHEMTRASFNEFATLLTLTDEERIVWGRASPAHDVYDYVKALRDATTVGGVLGATRGVLLSAGVMPMCGLFLRKSRIWPGYEYTKATDQFLKLFASSRYRNAVELIAES